MSFRLTNKGVYVGKLLEYWGHPLYPQFLLMIARSFIHAIKKRPPADLF